MEGILKTCGLSEVDNSIYKFSMMDIRILECGMTWINADRDAFTHNLCCRIMQDHAMFRHSLGSTTVLSFCRLMAHTLDRFIKELGSRGTITFTHEEHRNIRTIIKKFRVKPEHLPPITESYVNVFSELAEEAWSPAMENAWRQIMYVLWNMCLPQYRFLLSSSLTSPFPIIQRRKSFMSQPAVLFIGVLMFLAGSLGSIGLWGRYRLEEIKNHRIPLLKKVWCG